MITVEQLEQFLIRHDWKKDRWGHYRKGGLRFKITSHSGRIEKKTSAGWVRLRSAYLRDISVTENDKLSGMSVFGCGVPRPGI